jgi:RecG-like helicase
MTATPIPRTAAMVVFGDLDMTVIDELPPGRQPVTTRWLRTPTQAEEAWSRVRGEVAYRATGLRGVPAGRGSDRVEATSAVAEAERLMGRSCPDCGSACCTASSPRREGAGDGRVPVRGSMCWWPPP